MNLWKSFCPQCGGAKSEKAKRCKDCWKARKTGRKKRVRKVRKENPTKNWAIPTKVVLADGTAILTRSKLEAEWITALSDCDFCYECLILRIPQRGTYTPDLIIVNKDDNTVILLELKSNMEQAKEDPRPKKALSLSPALRFLIIGGYPRDFFYVKMMTSEGEKEFERVSLTQLLPLLGCRP